MSRITVSYPCRIQSEANLRGSWRKHDDRRKKHREQARIMLMTAAWPKGQAWSRLVVKLTRIAPVLIRDEHDNLGRAFKATTDGVADWLGLDDSDPRIAWAYAQEKRSAKQARDGKLSPYEVRIELLLDGCHVCLGAGELVDGDWRAPCPRCEEGVVAA